MCATPVAYGGKPHNSLFQTRLGDEPCRAAQESHDFNRGRCQTPSEISARSERRAIFVCPDCKKEFVTSVRAMTRAIASGATCCPDCKMRMRTISAARKDEHDYVKSVGTTMTMKNGSKATCIAYHGVNNITVEFEDWFVLYHARWNQFVRGALHHNQKNINE